MNRTWSDFLAPLRLVLLSLGLAVVWIVVSFFVGTDSAHADEAQSRSLLGGVVSGAVNTVDDQLTDAATAPLEGLTPAVTAPLEKRTDTATVPVEEAAAAVPVARTALSTVAEVVKAQPVPRLVAPVVETVDAVVEPVATVTGTDPVIELVDDVLVEVTAPEPGVAPIPPGVEVPTVVVQGGHTTVARADLAERTAPVSATISSWATELNSGLSVSPAASIRPYPDPVPRGPAENDHSALLSTPAISGGATAGGLAGPHSAAVLSSPFSLALISGALLSRAENDALPSFLPLELSSTPD
jgi:hypothetical protein